MGIFHVHHRDDPLGLGDLHGQAHEDQAVGLGRRDDGEVRRQVAEAAGHLLHVAVDLVDGAVGRAERRAQLPGDFLGAGVLERDDLDRAAGAGPVDFRHERFQARDVLGRVRDDQVVAGGERLQRAFLAAAHERLEALLHVGRGHVLQRDQLGDQAAADAAAGRQRGPAGHGHDPMDAVALGHRVAAGLQGAQVQGVDFRDRDRAGRQDRDLARDAVGHHELLAGDLADDLRDEADVRLFEAELHQAAAGRGRRGVFRGESGREDRRRRSRIGRGPAPVRRQGRGRTPRRAQHPRPPRPVPPPCLHREIPRSLARMKSANCRSSGRSGNSAAMRSSALSVVRSIRNTIL